MQRRVWLKGVAAAAIYPAALSPVRAEVGVTDQEIVIGTSAVLSGPLGTPVKSLLAGAQLAFDRANAANGVNGRKIRLVMLDDELKPDHAVANYKALLTEHKVFAFFGCVGSGTTAAAAGLLKESGAPLVGAYAVADSARQKTASAAYFLRAGTAREAQALVQHLTTLGVARIGMAQLDNPGGQEAMTLVELALARHQLKLQATAAVKPDASNVAEAGKALAAADLQAVIMYLGGGLPAELMKATWASGATPSFYGMSIVPGEVAAKLLGEHMRGLAISQVVPYPWGEVEAVARDYHRASEAAKQPVGYLAYEGYLNAMVMLEALQRVGKDPTRARLHASLRALKMRLAGMDIDFTAPTEIAGSHFVEMVHVTKEGRFVR